MGHGTLLPVSSVLTILTQKSLFPTDMIQREDRMFSVRCESQTLIQELLETAVSKVHTDDTLSCCVCSDAALVSRSEVNTFCSSSLTSDV